MEKRMCKKVWHATTFDAAVSIVKTGLWKNSYVTSYPIDELQPHERIKLLGLDKFEKGCCILEFEVCDSELLKIPPQGVYTDSADQFQTTKVIYPKRIICDCF